MYRGLPVVLIAAHDAGRGIGAEGRLLYRIPPDLKRFKSETMGATVLMGSKTYASLRGGLPGRKIIVLTRHPENFPDVATATSVPAAFVRAADLGAPIFIAGGGDIYQKTILLADRLELTEIWDRRPADAFFPKIPDAFIERSRISHPASGAHPAFDFVEYIRA